MKMMKKLCAVVLTLALTLTSFPAFALAADQAADTLIYNLGNQEVEIKTASVGESGETAVFNEDGSYTIQLEDDAFFPYEVQFKYGGNTAVHTFGTSDSTITVGSHKISVYSESIDPYAITRIGVYIGGEYIAATPEPKTFTNGRQGHTTFSLLPLTRDYLYLDLRNISPQQLESVELSAFIDKVNDEAYPAIAGDAVVSWDFLFDENGDRVTDSFRPVGSGPVNLNPSYYRTSSSMSMQLIAGSANQLDAGNTRYNITVEKVPDIGRIDLSMYTHNDHWDKVYIDWGIESSTQGDVANYKVSVLRDYSLDAKYYLSVGVEGSSDYDVKLYNGHFDSPEAAEANPGAVIPGDVNANFSTPQPFTVMCKLNGTVAFFQKITVQAVTDDSENSISLSRIYAQSATGIRASVDYSRSTTNDRVAGVTTYNVILKSGYIPDNDYYVNFAGYSGATGKNDISIITKAVAGHYNSLSAAAGQTDIKHQLFDTTMTLPDRGYKVNLKNDAKFTVFTDNEVLKFTIKAIENPGSGDTYLNIDGAVGINPYDVYKMPLNNDSGAQQFGYQILLIDDASANLSALKPTFTTFEGIDAYAGSKKQETGVDEHDFSSKSVKYTARAQNGKDVKNYWVSFVKAVSGAKLYVVVDGEKPGEREVFLDGYTNNRHDIFIANIGQDELTGLNVKLENAQNVQLDEYWKVGGNGNATLASFSTADANYYDELSNIAKIRLIPDGEGQVSGTLVISSDNGGKVTIDLKGSAGNPQIDTASLDNAVKFVPYAFLITTNNKYNWNKVTFSLVSGSRLPDGMILRPSGEIYGVPTQTGEFPITVRARHSHSGFSDTTASFTLTVLENTDDNVRDSIDAGYEILDPVPRNMATMPSRDIVFLSDGSLDYFVDFWLDGVRLKPNVDYTADKGSTAITIRSQTFQNYGSGTHTIAGEFRDDDDKLNRSAQNYTVSSSGTGGTGGTGGTSLPSGSGNTSSGTRSSGGGSSSGGSSSSQSSMVTTVPKLAFKMRGIDFISLSDLKELATLAKKEGKSPWLDVDSISSDGKSVDVRVSVNPELAAKAIYMAGSTYNGKALQIKKLFERFFRNEIVSVISLSQKTSFGQAATICVKVPSGTSAQDLNLYSFDPDTNLYRRIENASIRVDRNGYLHFTTNYADNIVISKGKLERK